MTTPASSSRSTIGAFEGASGGSGRAVPEGAGRPLRHTFSLTVAGTPSHRLSGAPAAQVADYALLRAADLALADGYDWFRVVDRYTAQSGEGGGPRVSIGAGGGSGGYRSGVGVGLGTSFNLGGGPAVVQSIEVLMGKGRPAPAGPEVYDAREVRRTVGTRI